MAEFGVVDTLRWESFDVAQAALEAITVPPTTADTAGLVGVITQAQANLAAHHGRPGEVDGPLNALRTAKGIFPTKVRRDPMVRETVATLLPGAGRDAVDMEIRGLAYRSGLSV